MQIKTNKTKILLARQFLTEKIRTLTFLYCYHMTALHLMKLASIGLWPRQRAHFRTVRSVHFCMTLCLKGFVQHKLNRSLLKSCYVYRNLVFKVLKKISLLAFFVRITASLNIHRVFKNDTVLKCNAFIFLSTKRFAYSRICTLSFRRATTLRNRSLEQRLNIIHSLYKRKLDKN